jgi:vacuolar-type H+-ATPase subunit E/Vma4
MKPLGSVAAVVAAIREDAEAEVETLDRHAQTEIARLGADHVSLAVSLPDAELRLATARQRARARLAQEDWEDTSEMLAERERWMARAVELGRRQLADRGDPRALRDRMTTLAREALVRLPEGALEVVVSEADAACLGRDWLSGLVTPAHPEKVRVVAGPVDGGCIVRTVDGRASFDNTYAARARRFETAWRSALAAIYEEHVPPAAPPAPVESKR